METNGTNGTQKSTALATVKPGAAAINLANAYEPHNYGEAMKIAETLSKSKMFGVKTSEEAFVIMSTGADLGLSPTAALRSIYVVNNRPGLSSDLMVALCLQAPDCEYFRCVESTAERATYAAKRKGDPERRHTWTIEQAKRAKLSDKDAWKAYPEDMLKHRAAAPLARELFPHRILNLYCPEELEEIGEREAASAGQHIAEAEIIEAAATDDLEDRVTALLAQLDAAQTTDDLKAFRTAVAADPASTEIKSRVKDAYDAKAAEIKAGA